MFHEWIHFVEQANLPQDINIQFTGKILDCKERKYRKISLLEVFIKNKEYVHATLELIEVSFIIESSLIVEEILLGN